MLTRIGTLLLALLLLPGSPVHAEWSKADRAIMGTAIHLEFWSEKQSQAQAQNLIDDVVAEFQRIDALMSTYKEDSELSKVNRLAATEPVVVSEELFGLLEQALRYSVLSDGAFDITYASVGYMYDYRERVKPSDEEIAAKLGAINYRHVVLDPGQHSVRFARQGVRVDLGGIAKGYAVDRAIGLLQAQGIAHALVSAGGDTRIIGDKRGRPWVTAIRHPRQREDFAALLPLNDTAISTSGDYERYFIEGDVRYHHIISPKTGKSAQASRSATVLGPDATTTDALSTTVFILGPKDGLALVNRLEGIDAVVIDSDGRMHYSDGLLRQQSEPPG